MSPSERPLLVELHWNEDDREGKFVLRDLSRSTRPRASAKVCLLLLPLPVSVSVVQYSAPPPPP